MLFEPKERTDMEWLKLDETEFGYLDRSGRDYSARAREVLNNWFSHVPEDKQDAMRAGLASGDEVLYASTIFELGIHEIGLRLGCKPEIHPEMVGTLKRPDFRFRREDGTSFIVEARDFTGISDQERKAERRRQEAYLALNTIPSPDFSLCLNIRGRPYQNVPCARLKHEVRSWLAMLNYDEVLTMKNTGQLDNMTPFEWRRDGWHIEFRVRPKLPSFRGTGGSAIGSISSGGPSIGVQPILDTLEDKAKKYGEMTEPFVIALNVTSRRTDQRELEAALFGVPGLLAHFGPEEDRLNFQSKGLWFGKERCRNRQVSGVMFFYNFNVWHAARAGVDLYINPNATRPLVGPFNSFPRKIVDGVDLRDHEGVPLEKLFGLPPTWPETA